MLDDILRETRAFQEWAKEGKEQVALINDPAVLQNLTVKISLSSTLDEAKKLLFDWPGTNNGHN